MKSNRIRHGEIGFTIPFEPELNETMKCHRLQAIYDDMSGKLFEETEVWKARIEELEDI